MQDKLLFGSNAVALCLICVLYVDSDSQTTEEISEDRRMLRMKKAMEDAMKDLQKESTDIEEAVFWKNEEKEGRENIQCDPLNIQYNRKVYHGTTRYSVTCKCTVEQLL